MDKEDFMLAFIENDDIELREEEIEDFAYNIFQETMNIFCTNCFNNDHVNPCSKDVYNKDRMNLDIKMCKFLHTWKEMIYQMLIDSQNQYV